MVENITICGLKFHDFIKFMCYLASKISLQFTPTPIKIKFDKEN